MNAGDTKTKSALYNHNFRWSKCIRNYFRRTEGKLKAILFKSKLELIDDKKAILIDKIKYIIIEMVY